MANHSIKMGRLVILCIPLALIGLGIYLWNSPLLGKPMTAFPTEIPRKEQSNPVDTPVVEALPASSDPFLATTAPEVVERSENVEPLPEQNSAGSWLILALGTDRVSQTDVIRLIRVDFQDQKVTVVSIPRDLFLPLPGFEDHGITQGRINATYGYGEFFFGQGQGVISTANAFTANFGMSFDRYIVGQFSSFIQLVDRVHGIDVTLEEGYYGPASDGPSFDPGIHHLHGEEALGLARVRYADDDHHRIDRQTLIIKALMGKVVESMNIFEMTSFGLETIKGKGVVTDLTIGDLVALARLGKTLTPDDISFVSIPREYYYPATTTSGGSIILPREGLVPFVQAQLGIGE